MFKFQVSNYVLYEFVLYDNLTFVHADLQSCLCKKSTLSFEIMSCKFRLFISIRKKKKKVTHLSWFASRYGDQIVAVKLLNSGKTPEEKVSLERRFAREVTMMSRVKHENLVKVCFPVFSICLVLNSRNWEDTAISSCILLLPDPRPNYFILIL